jgi:hypothetical protein
MSVDPTNMPSGGTSKISQWLNANPTLALGGVIIVVLLVGSTLIKAKTPSASTAVNPAGTTQDLSGLTTNASGQAIAYVPTTTSFDTYNATNTGTQVTSSGTGAVVVTPAPVVVPPVVGVPVGVRNPPVTSPPKISMQWTEGYVSHNQSLNLIASNDTTDMNNKAARDFAGTGMVPTRFSVTGQQIYNQNKGTVDAFFSAHGIKGDKLTTGTTGMSLVLPTIVLG